MGAILVLCFGLGPVENACNDFDRVFSYDVAEINHVHGDDAKYCYTQFLFLRWGPADDGEAWVHRLCWQKMPTNSFFGPFKDDRGWFFVHYRDGFYEWPYKWPPPEPTQGRTEIRVSHLRETWTQADMSQHYSK